MGAPSSVPRPQPGEHTVVNAARLSPRVNCAVTHAGRCGARWSSGVCCGSSSPRAHALTVDHMQPDGRRGERLDLEQDERSSG
jgi:hypothetical protein